MSFQWNDLAKTLNNIKIPKDALKKIGEAVHAPEAVVKKAGEMISHLTPLLAGVGDAVRKSGSMCIHVYNASDYVPNVRVNTSGEGGPISHKEFIRFGLGPGNHDRVVTVKIKDTQERLIKHVELTSGCDDAWIINNNGVQQNKRGETWDVEDPAKPIIPWDIDLETSYAITDKYKRERPNAMNAQLASSLLSSEKSKMLWTSKKSPWKSHTTFKAKETLGGGAFGTVFMAQQDGTENIFAIKRVSLVASFRTLGDMNKILREIEVPKHIQLDCDFVTKYYDSWFEDTEKEIKQEEIILPDLDDYTSTTVPPETHFMFLRMELCDGDLAKWLKNAQSESEDESQLKRLMFEVASGLAAIHTAKIIHRDIKPANILFKQYSDGDFVWKIGDFGLGVFNEGESDKTKSINRGTRTYFSPEMSKPQKNYTSKTDIYSLGLVFLELFLDDLEQSQRNYLFEDLRTNTELSNEIAVQELTRDTCPKELITQMLNHSPQTRPTAQEIIQKLIN